MSFSWTGENKIGGFNGNFSGKFNGSSLPVALQLKPNESYEVWFALFRILGGNPAGYC